MPLTYMVFGRDLLAIYGRQHTTWEGWVFMSLLESWKSGHVVQLSARYRNFVDCTRGGIPT